MRLENRVQKLEKIAETASMPRVVMVDFLGPNDTPTNEEQSRKLKEGEAAEARGERIQWVLVYRSKGRIVTPN
jgi:hypothetical protein